MPSANLRSLGSLNVCSHLSSRWHPETLMGEGAQGSEVQQCQFGVGEISPPACAVNGKNGVV